MKRIAISAALCAAAIWGIPAYAQSAPNAVADGTCPKDGNTPRVQLTFDGVRSDKGTLTVAIYGDKSSDFLARGKKVAKGRVAARIGTVHACLTLPKFGVFALVAYHDENGDTRFNRTLIGLPAEGYAFSNNPTSLVGLPPFRSVAFSVGPEVKNMALHVHYP